jgi:hypothetical protein
VPFEAFAWGEDIAHRADPDSSTASRTVWTWMSTVSCTRRA